MSLDTFPHHQLLQVARFNPKDITKIHQSHRLHNRLGFAYQLAFVRVHNRFPAQDPLEVIEALLTYVSVQLSDLPLLLYTIQQIPKRVELNKVITIHYSVYPCGTKAWDEGP